MIVYKNPAFLCGMPGLFKKIAEIAQDNIKPMRIPTVTYNFKNFIASVIVTGFFSFSTLNAQVRIMPLGDSETFDYNSFDKNNPRPDGDRIAYRYKLYQLLVDAGYTPGSDFDFAGSRNAGNNYFQNSEMDDVAAIPGLTTQQLEHLIRTGENQNHLAFPPRYECGTYYFSCYPADIILLHIGTNNLVTTSTYVSTLLNTIRFYDPEIYILVARIINRNPYHPNTTIFNDNVEAMIAARNDSRIFTVDLETGAGLNYSTDMIDELHPNQAGYDKIAAKWFEAIHNINSKPVISDIPAQQTNKGEAFDDIDLFANVVDVEDNDFKLTYCITQQPGSQLDASIYTDPETLYKYLRVCPADDEWSGTETIWLKVTDTGYRCFKSSDSVQIIFTVETVNNPPVIRGQYDLNMDENTEYTISLSQLIVEDTDTDPEDLTLSILNGFNYTFNGLTLIPNKNFTGDLLVNVKVCDPYACSQVYKMHIVVNNVNDPPVIQSVPIDEADDYVEYSYTIVAEDTNAGDTVKFFIAALPDWLDFNPVVHTVRGTPRWNDAGYSYDVSIGVTDLQDTIYQEYEVFVYDINDPPEFDSEPVTHAYLNTPYLYKISYFDKDENDVVSLNLISIPAWLKYISGAKTLAGIPPDNSAGDEYPVVLEISDGEDHKIQTFSITVHSGLGISEDINNNKMELYPNPGNGIVNINLRNIFISEVLVYDNGGRLLRTFSVSGCSDVLILDMTDLEPGFYYMSFLSEEGKYLKKFIIN